MKHGTTSLGIALVTLAVASVGCSSTVNHRAVAGWGEVSGGGEFVDRAPDRLARALAAQTPPAPTPPAKSDDDDLPRIVWEKPTVLPVKPEPPPVKPEPPPVKPEPKPPINPIPDFPDTKPPVAPTTDDAGALLYDSLQRDGIDKPRAGFNRDVKRASRTSEGFTKFYKRILEALNPGF